jgi:peptidoglycan/LPS O-acetylase OafA/YrhL
MRNEDLMRLLAALGGVIVLIEAISGFGDKKLENVKVITLVIGIILAVIILLSVISPNKPIPMNWIIYVVLGVVMIVYISTIGGILVLIAGFVGYTER